MLPCAIGSIPGVDSQGMSSGAAGEREPANVSPSSLERGKFRQFSPFSYRIKAAPPPGLTIPCPRIARV